MRAHQADLRAEVLTTLREEDGLQARDAESRAAAFAADIAAQGSEAAPDERLRELLRYAERLALQPASVAAQHIDALRAVGYDDRAVHDAAQAAAYFAYINRIADGLGVDLEPEMQG